jgi:release factor glutamine methyltransferase
VTPDTLIPRPETELLVETALNIFNQKRVDGSLIDCSIKRQATVIGPVAKVSSQDRMVADLGTGAGAIALALASEQPEWQLYATDKSTKGLKVAKANAQYLSLKNVSFYTGYWCRALPRADFDMIISNPPYLTVNEWLGADLGLRFEPGMALVSGGEGLDALREIVALAPSYLRVGGYLLVEHGFAQGEAVRHLFTARGYDAVVSIRDLSGKERVTRGRWEG